MCFPNDTANRARGPIISLLVLVLVPILVPAVVRGQSPVVVAPVVSDEVGPSQDFVGTVMPVKRAIVGSAVDGRISEFPLKAGDPVEESGTLAQILTSTIELERKAAKAELRLRRKEKDELNNGTRTEDLERAEAETAAAAAAADFARASLARSEKLFREGTITRESFESARSAAKVAVETLNERKSAMALGVAGPRVEQIAQAEARVAMQSAVVEKLTDQIKKHTVISRFKGYVVAEHTEIGAWVKRGDPVAEVAALDEVDIVAHVLEGQVPFVKRGQTVRIEIPALPDRPFNGTVVQIVPQADVRTRTFPVVVRLENEIEDDVPLVKAGMLARIHLPTGAVRKSLLVPKDAIVLGGAKPLVFVVDRPSRSEPTGTVRPVPVELGIAVDNSKVVVGELKPGDEVVVRGNERVRPGQQVTVVEARTSEDASTTRPAP